MTKYKEWNLEPIDLLVGGTPCQSFSVAGLRRGLEDPRGNLALTYVGILDRFRPKWCVWENVPGVLSSNGGRDFGSFLGALAELGYGFAYRVLDAQYFGVAQRRRRVFVVGHLGDWRRAAAVLFERESLRGDPAPSREKGKAAAGTVTTRSGNSSAGGIGTDEACGGYLQPVSTGVDPETVATLCATDAAKWGSNQWVKEGKAILQPIPFGVSEQPDVGHCLRSGASKADKHESTTYIAQSMAVRRLTPTECERLQGFPDNYTNIPWRKAIDSPDGPRYKALGNSMAVPVMKWIGERIKLQMLTPAS
jgi:DNA (cytosine-5)-methyltransferase 1